MHVTFNYFREMIEKELPPDGGGSNLCCLEKFFMGFKECQEEVLQYLIETEGVDPKDSFCQRVSSHLDQTSSKFLKTNAVKAAAETREMKADDASALYPTNNTQSNGSPYQGMNISENNMEMINQDEHLRTLLKPRSKEHRTSQTSGYCSSSGLSLSDGGTSSCITLQSVQRDSAEKEAASGSGGSQCSSEQNLSDGSTNNKDYRKCNVYKFKHNITKRFSEEGKPFLLKSDTSSNDSREEDVEHSKQKVFSYRMDSPCTDSTPYPSSEISSGTNCCSGKHKSPRYKNRNDNCEERFDSQQVPLPAFVLHPLGTHYVPVTIHPSHFRSVFKDEAKASTAYHPISIPVNFCGPSVSIHTQVKQKLLCSSQGDERSSDNSQKLFRN